MSREFSRRYDTKSGENCETRPKMSYPQHTLSVPSLLSFSDDTVKFERNVTDYDYKGAYAPTPEMQNELRRISGKLDDCLYDDYRREIDTLKPNVQIDKELTALMAAEEDIKQSRRNLRRRAKKICPTSGPTEAEERELKTLNKYSLRKMYELEDFKRDFDTKPFVATEMVDMSLERLEDNIRKRQLALQNYRREIYEASVLRVAGYYGKDKVAKKTSSPTLVKSSKHAANVAMQMHKRAFGTTLEASNVAQDTTTGNPDHTSKSTSGNSKYNSGGQSKSYSEDDESCAKVEEIYRAERLRFNNNLKMFNTRIQEFLESHQTTQIAKKHFVEAEEESNTYLEKVKSVRSEKPEVRKKLRFDPNPIIIENKADIDTEKSRKKTRKERDSLRERSRQKFSDESEDSYLGRKPQTDKKVKRRKRSPRPRKEDDQASSDERVPMKRLEKDRNMMQPIREVGSDLEVTKKRVILPLPTLDPMPVYTDNYQASCALTHLFSSRDDFDEDFEPDYVIPPYESERLVYTGKQLQVHSHLSKHTSGRKNGRR